MCNVQEGLRAAEASSCGELSKPLQRQRKDDGVGDGHPAFPARDGHHVHPQEARELSLGEVELRAVLAEG